MSIRLVTGRIPNRNAVGSRPRTLTSWANPNAATMASKNPIVNADSPSLTAFPERRSSPSAMLVIAPYSGPRTIAATMRIWELVSMPTAPMTPATIRKR